MSEAREALESAVAQLESTQKEIEIVSMAVGTVCQELLLDEPNAGQEYLEAALFNLREAAKDIMAQIEKVKDESEAEENLNG